MSEPTHRTERSRRRLWITLTVLIAMVGLAVRLWAPGPTTEVYDENLWLHRSDNFIGAISNGHLAQASAEDHALGLTNATMPGVTTMWAGVLGRQVAKASGSLGLSAPVSGPSDSSPQVLRAAQGVVSTVCVALLVAVMVLLKGLFDRRTSVFAGALLATEPWFVALSHVLHTDALVAMFSITSLCALSWALHDENRACQPTTSTTTSPTTSTTPPGTRLGWIIVAALAAALALLTKVNAIGIIAPGMAFITWTAWRHRYRGHATALIRPAVLGLGVMIVATVALWPALLVAPYHEAVLVFHASKQVGRTRLRYFHGSERGFILQFYAVALAFRLTPWMIVWCLAGVAGGVVDRIRRFHNRARGPDGHTLVPAWILVTPIPYLIVISLSRFGYARYAAVLIPFGAIAGACVVARASRRLAVIENRSPRTLAAIGVVALVFSAAPSIRSAPFGLQYASPLLGGQSAAARWIPVESAQTSALLSQRLRRHLRDAQCARVLVADPYQLPASDGRCGIRFTPRTVADLARADYAVSHAPGGQSPSPDWYVPWLRLHAEKIAHVRIGGVTFGEVWRIPARSD